MKKKILIVLTSILLTSCATRHQMFFRGDIIGFSDVVKTSYTTETRGLLMNMKPQSEPFDLKKGEKHKMYQAMDKVPRGSNTTAYYAMELAAERVKYVRKKIAKNDPNTRYYIFLLTDGLDNASPQVAKNDKRILFSVSPEQYQKRVHRKLKSAMGWFHKNTYEVYTLMYEGEDAEETMRINRQTRKEYETMLKEDMECFRYASNGEAPELIHGTNFDYIIEKVRERLDRSSYTFRVPISYKNKKIKMEFENNKGEKVTLTAMLKKSLLSYYLTDISLNGNGNGNATISKEVTTLQANPTYLKTDNVNAYFVLEDFRLNDIAYSPVGNLVTQDYEYKPGSGIWVRNSEYHEVTDQAINTYFILVIDGSSSLDGKNHDKNGFEEEKKMAKKIMRIMSSDTSE